jgi:type I restriction enzyme M protein
MERETALAAPVSVATGTVPEGWVADFLTGKHVRDTPEEYVRQNLEKALVRQYKFEARDCQPEFPIKVGSARKRVDVVVFAPGALHRQEDAYILVETKRAGTSPSSKTEGVDQLRSYLAACLNARCSKPSTATSRRRAASGRNPRSTRAPSAGPCSIPRRAPTGPSRR